MLLPDNINPELTIYYNGAFLINELKNNHIQTFISLYENIKCISNMSFSTYILCLDWLFLIDVAKINKNGDVELCLLKS